MPVSRASSAPSPICQVRRSLRPVQDRVAVKPDQVDRDSRMCARGTRATAAACSRGQLALDRGDRPRAAEHAAQPLAELVRIGHGQRRPGDRRGLARRSRSTATSMPSSEVPLIRPSARRRRQA